MVAYGEKMAALRESPSRAGLRLLAPVGQVLGEPRFRWRPHEGAWLYRLEMLDDEGRPIARGWSGTHELPLAWLRDEDGYPPELAVGGAYKWRVFAYDGPPTGTPAATAPEAEFLFLGP